MERTAGVPRRACQPSARRSASCSYRAQAGRVAASHLALERRAVLLVAREAVDEEPVLATVVHGPLQQADGDLQGGRTGWRLGGEGEGEEVGCKKGRRRGRNGRRGGVIDCGGLAAVWHMLTLSKPKMAAGKSSPTAWRRAARAHVGGHNLAVLDHVGNHLALGAAALHVRAQQISRAAAAGTGAAWNVATQAGKPKRRH